PKTSIICSPMTSLKTSIKTITYLSDIGCLEIQGASLVGKHKHTEYEARCQKNAFSGCHTWSLSSASAFATIIS
ncbi:hypothetical protein UZB02_24665, partial [Escherichia coli]|nr:hypothetical protein [Escherichia coli]